VILEATLRLIGERGLQAVRHRTVAEAAGASLGSVPYYFSTRERLLEEALLYAARRDIERLDRFALDLQAQAFDTEAWIDLIAATLAGDLEADPIRWLASYELLLASARNPKLRDVMTSWNAAYRRMAELGLRAAGSTAPDLHAELLVATITGALLKQLAYPLERFESDVLKPLLHELITSLVR
jgi:DNA-binding transcriptional regulator YbjK